MNHSIAAVSLTTLALACPALADVTPSDVWANQGAIFQAMGGTLSATLREGGTTTEVTGIRGDFALPMGFGSVTATISDLNLVDNGDGSVTMRYPASTDITMAFDIPAVGTGTVTLRILDAYDQVATGDAGDVTYTYDVPTLRMEITDLNAEGPAFDSPEMAVFRDATIEGLLTINGNTGTVRATEGDLLELLFDGTAANQVYDFTFSTGDGIVSSQKGSAGATTFQSAMALPSSGTSVMALPAALRDGLSISLRSDVEKNATEQMLKIGEEVIQTSKDFTERLDTTIAIDADGLRMDGSADGFSMNMTDQNVMPFPIEFAIDKLTAAYAIPLLASDQPLPFTFRTGVGGLTVSDTLWSLFDPSSALPRDPADINIDLTGMVGSEIDLLDFEALAALEEAETVPFSIHEVTIADLLLSAVGAKLTGSGAFTFNMDDLQTFDGVPAPTGAVDLSLVGGNALIDTLVSMGLLPEEQAMGARMMMGLFARPGDGEDTLVSKIEIDGETGQISANGQRLR